MKILKNVILAPFTTFKIGGPAKYFCIVKNINEAKKAVIFAKQINIPFFFLGGGSNVLVSDDGYKGLIIKIENKGIEILTTHSYSHPIHSASLGQDLGGERGDKVYIKVASGENWDNFVKFAVNKNLGGIENLSHIPGSTGAVAVQNVGAYGEEAADVILNVEALNTKTLKSEVLSNKQCKFGYRKSIFNNEKKGVYIIFHIVFELKKNAIANVKYRDLATRFEDKNPSLKQVRNAVISIRNKKYPFPKNAKNGNAGSFFKNITLDKRSFNKMLLKISKKFGKKAAEELNRKKFIGQSGKIKVPASALIELCGFKNSKVGGAEINKTQPLVIINKTGKAMAKDVLKLAENVSKTLFFNFGVKIEFEPCLLGFENDAKIE